MFIQLPSKTWINLDTNELVLPSVVDLGVDLVMIDGKERWLEAADAEALEQALKDANRREKKA
jgi:hypothetical protein